MRVIVSPSAATGSLSAPSSKSSMQRACAAALLHNGTTIIYNAGISNDDKAALNIIQHLGAKVKYDVDKISIESKGFSAADSIENKEISCGAVNRRRNLRHHLYDEKICRRQRQPRIWHQAASVQAARILERTGWCGGTTVTAGHFSAVSFSMFHAIIFAIPSHIERHYGRQLHSAHPSVATPH